MIKIVLALVIGGVIGFTVAKDQQINDWVSKQAAAVKRQVHDWTR